MSELPPGLDAALATTAPLTERFTAEGHRLFLVGGVVRDHLLDRRRPEADLDATTAARPDEIKAIVAPIAEAVWSQGERFGTVGCTVGGQPFEITTHRAESYDDDSRKPTVLFGDDITDDLARRDFTVNAMAVDAATGELVDPYGGRDDLAASMLRTPLDPEVSFSEDPLRMLRAARFHAGYDLTPAPELEAAIAALLDRMAIVSVERIRDELQKLLLLDTPGPGMAMLARTGLLARVLPKLGELGEADAAALCDRAAVLPEDAAMRWSAVLGPFDVGPRDLSALRFSGDLSRDVIWFCSANPALEDPSALPADAPAVRRAAALAPGARTIEELLTFVEAQRRAAGRSVDDLEIRRSVLSDLRSAEPDLDDPNALLAGEQVCALLRIEPGPDIGVATRWLRDLRFDEGPMPAGAAAERLLSW